MTTIHEPAVDAFAVDQSAITALDVAAQTAGVDFNVRIVGGPTRVYLHSREQFKEWCAARLLRVESAFDITVQGREVHVPVLFGGPTYWRAVAIYPAQDPCPCRAELVHMAGCPVGDPDTWPECPECSVLNGSHQAWCLGAAAAIPVVVLDVPRYSVTAAYDLAHVEDQQRTRSRKVERTWRGEITPERIAADHDAALGATLPQRTPGAALAANPPLELLASVLVEEVAE